MSSRERWTIYPLMFLALGAALRGKLTNTFDVGAIKSNLVAAKNIQCDDMVVLGRVVIVDQDGRPRMRLGCNPQDDTGAIEIYGRDGRLVVANLGADAEANAGMLALQTADGRPQITLGSGARGGVVETFDLARATKVDFDSRGITAGIFIEGFNKRLPPRRQDEPSNKKLPQN